MIVQRLTWVVKKGCMNELVALLREEAAKSAMTTRAYTPNVGKNNILAVEFEFESLAEMEKVYAEWAPKPETVLFLKKWDELTEPGGGSEIWNLAIKM